jgi:hypothetical protein
MHPSAPGHTASALPAHPARLPLLFGLGVFAYLALFCFQGVNWTDEGYHYTLFRLLFANCAGDAAQLSLLHWLNILVGGAWLRLWPGGGMLWLRLEWALAWAVIAALSLVLTRRFQPGRLSTLLAAAAVAVATFHNPSVVEYNQLNTLLVVSLGLLYVSIVRAPRGGLLRYVLCGVLLALCAPAKITFASAPAVFLAFLLLARCPTREILCCAAAYAVGSGLALLALEQFGALDNYIATIRAFAGDQRAHAHHGLAHLMGIYRDTLVYSTIYGAACLATAHIVARFAPRMMRRPAPLPTTLLCCAALVTLFAVLRNFSFAIVGACGFAVLAALAAARRESPEQAKVLGLLFCLALAATFGSNFPAHTFKYPLAYLLPPTFAFLVQRPPQYRRPAYVSLALVFLCLAVAFKFSNPYLDLAQRWRLNIFLQVPAARHIATTPAKAKAIDELYAASRRLLAASDQVIAFPELPLAHFLLGKKPALRYPWMEIQPPDTFEANLEHAATTLPPVIVGSFNPQTRSWAPMDFKRSDYAGYYARMFRFLADHAYAQAWKNDFFTMYLPPAAAGANAVRGPEDADPARAEN